MHGAGIVFVPKAHGELVGRGVEHSRGASKIRFRHVNSKLTNNGRMSNLKERAHELLSETPIDIIQKCSRKAREDELSYLHLLSDVDCDLKLKDIEKMKKEHKGKRCVLDQDKSVVQDIAKVIEDENIVVKDEFVCVIDLTQNFHDNDANVREKN